MSVKQPAKKSSSPKSVIKNAPPKKKAVPQNAATHSEDPEENMLQSLFIITEHWKSDLIFFTAELAFLLNLAENHFTNLIHEIYNDDTKKTASALIALEERRLQIQHKTEKHLQHLANLIKNPFPYNAQVFKDEHEKLENAMTSFVKDFREVKKKMFKLTEHFLESDKVKSLLRLTENNR